MNGDRSACPAPRVALILRPHLERRDGLDFHGDRFDAHLDGELICVSRQPRLDGARALLARGWPPTTLLNTRHQEHAYDNWRRARPIGELAGWTVGEEDRAGLRRRRWQPFDGRSLVGRGAENGRSGRGRCSDAPDVPAPFSAGPKPSEARP